MKTSALATDTTTLAAERAAVTSDGLLLPVASLWWREIVRFYRQRSRVVGVIASPVVFWLVIGSGFGQSFRGAGNEGYLEYFFPGSLMLVVLFTSIFTMMSVIEDRREGFLLSVLVAPVHPAVLVLAKVLGGATLASLQGLIFLAFAPLVGASLTWKAFAMAALIIALTAFALTALGFAVAWRLDSTQAFHAIVNLFLIPLWLLSGALFPVSGASGWIRVVMRANPLTYGVEALRHNLFPAEGAALGTSLELAVLAGFSLAMFLLAYAMAQRRTTRPA